MDTIFAQATAPGRAGVSIVRISGPDADRCLAAFGVKTLPEARQSALRRLFVNDELLDQALVLRFPRHHSFTGEAVVELHLHGSQAVVRKTLQALGDIPGHRMAEAGEFTHRALQNNRMDETQVEALADLIDAETEAQRRQANIGFSGAFAKRIEDWRQHLLRAAALTEASIDFADEEIPTDVFPEVAEILKSLTREFCAEIDHAKYAERIRDGFVVAIVGAPNVGKSTLLNRIAGRQAAITSEIAGTTRDVIEVKLDLAGLPVTFLDTAGLRKTDDQIEAIGVGLALARAKEADLRIFLGNAADFTRELLVDEDLQVSEKADLQTKCGDLAVSGLTGQGVDELLTRVSEVLLGRFPGQGSATRERHQQALRVALEDLEDARALLKYDIIQAELVAEAIRKAIAALDSLVGRIGVEDLLGEIFSSFCIGK